MNVKYFCGYISCQLFLCCLVGCGSKTTDFSDKIPRNIQRYAVLLSQWGGRVAADSTAARSRCLSWVLLEGWDHMWGKLHSVFCFPWGNYLVQMEQVRPKPVKLLILLLDFMPLNSHFIVTEEVFLSYVMNTEALSATTKLFFSWHSLLRTFVLRVLHTKIKSGTMQMSLHKSEKL